MGYLGAAGLELDPNLCHRSMHHPGDRAKAGPSLSLNEIPGPKVRGWGEVPGEAGWGH